MRPNRLTVPSSDNRSFDIRHETVPYFDNPWHFHPELELNFVVESAGTRFIGNSIEKFDAGEIVLLGKHLSHYWKNDARYYQEEIAPKPQAIVVRFMEDFAGNFFFTMPETHAIHGLFERARVGLRLLDPLRSSIAESLLKLTALEGFDQLMLFLTILHEIASSEHISPISPDYKPNILLAKDRAKLGKVYAYLHNHFTVAVTLAQVAEVASMNEAAFCRYFKSQTGKTFTAYLTDLRIRYACDLLSKSDAPVADICYKVGFENVSHFIQAFKKQTHKTPLAFRKAVL